MENSQLRCPVDKGELQTSHGQGESSMELSDILPAENTILNVDSMDTVLTTDSNDAAVVHSHVCLCPISPDHLPNSSKLYCTFVILLYCAIFICLVNLNLDFDPGNLIKIFSKLIMIVQEDKNEHTAPQKLLLKKIENED